MRTLFVLLLLPVLSFGQKIPAATFVDIFNHISDKQYVIQAVEGFKFLHGSPSPRGEAEGWLEFGYKAPDEEMYAPVTEVVRYVNTDSVWTFSLHTRHKETFLEWPAELSAMGFQVARQDSDSTSKYTYYKKASLTVILQDKITGNGDKRYFLRVRRG